MSQAEIAENLEEKVVRPRRIDGPHAVGSPTPVAELAAVAEMTSVAVAEFHPAGSADLAVELELPEEERFTSAESLADREEQLEHQAAQLADHLGERLRGIEHREAELNSRAAELDNQFRLSRLRTQETLAELRERETAIAAAEAQLAAHREEVVQYLQRQAGEHSELEKHLLALNERERTLAEQESALANRESQLAAKEADLRERRQFIEREAAALQHARQEWERYQSSEQLEIVAQRDNLRQELNADLSRREEGLSAGETLLAEHARELDRDRQTLARERSEWERQKTADKEALTLHRHRADAELEQRRTRLIGREAALDKQQAALDQLRCEITAAHRQSIEMRLTAEQLWSQVQGRMPPAEVTQSIAQLRLKLGEQYRLEQQGLVQQKQELLRLAEKVAEQSVALRSQRQELQSWFTSREEEIERHAESLVHREQEIQEQVDRIRHDEDHWQADRRNLEQQLRELHSRLRQVAA